MVVEKLTVPSLCLCLVTDRRLLSGGRSLPDVVTQAVSGGVSMVQLREKDLPSDELLPIARALREAVAGRALLIVNGDTEVARAMEADGIHLAEGTMAVTEARRALGDERLVGRSRAQCGISRSGAGRRSRLFDRRHCIRDSLQAGQGARGVGPLADSGREGAGPVPRHRGNRPVQRRQGDGNRGRWGRGRLRCHGGPRTGGGGRQDGPGHDPNDGPPKVKLGADDDFVDGEREKRVL